MSNLELLLPAAQAQRPLYAGIDLGGTNIKCGLVDDLGRTLVHVSTPTEVERGPEDGARRMGEAVHRMIAAAGVPAEEVVRVGLASPGTMDIPRGLLLRPHNLPGWFDFPLRDRVGAHCGLPVTFANDANAAAYGEYWVGCGREFHSMVLLTLGTGIGGGVIIGDMLIEGQHSHGGECGHIIIDYTDSARRCPCGQLGHLEGYASATAVVARVQETLRAGRPSSLSGRLSAGDELTPKLVAEEAEAGDDLSMEIILETARYLGVGIVTLIHVLDPDGVVLGGAMTFGGAGHPLGEAFLDRVRREVQARAFPVLAERVAVEFATLEGDAGFIGAAGLARQAWRRAQRSETAG